MTPEFCQPFLLWTFRCEKTIC